MTDNLLINNLMSFIWNSTRKEIEDTTITIEEDSIKTIKEVIIDDNDIYKER